MRSKLEIETRIECYEDLLYSKINGCEGWVSKRITNQVQQLKWVLENTSKNSKTN